MTDLHSDALPKRVIAFLRNRQARLVTVESCTGGLISGALTDIAGSSDVVEGGFVTYSNALKVSAVGVPPEMIETYGAVSEQVARAMAVGGLDRASNATISVAVTGIAGPGGGSSEKPVGTVAFGLATRDGVRTFRRRFSGDRLSVRRQTVETALQAILEI